MVFRVVTWIITVIIGAVRALCLRCARAVRKRPLCLTQRDRNNFLEFSQLVNSHSDLLFLTTYRAVLFVSPYFILVPVHCLCAMCDTKKNGEEKTSRHTTAKQGKKEAVNDPLCYPIEFTKPLRNKLQSCRPLIWHLMCLTHF